MGVWTAPIYTERGLNLQAKLIAGHKFELTRIVIGAGYSDPETLFNQTALVDPKHDITVEKIEYKTQGKCILHVYISNDGITEGFIGKEIGFFANDPDLGEILYMVSQYEFGTEIASEADMPGYSSHWQYVLRYGQADNVEITVDPEAFVTNKGLEARLEAYTVELKTGLLPDKPDLYLTEEHPTANGLWAWFQPIRKRLVSDDSGTFVLNLVDRDPFDGDVVAGIEGKDYTVENATTDETKVTEGSYLFAIKN